MEELGIGRPSTYAPTISTLFDRLYVEREGRQLKPTELGVTVTTMLEAHFRNIVDTDFTAEMENELDEVENGTRNWVEVLSTFYKPFHQDVEKAMKQAEKIVIEDIPTGKNALLVRWATWSSVKGATANSLPVTVILTANIRRRSLKRRKHTAPNAVRRCARARSEEAVFCIFVTRQMILNAISQALTCPSTAKTVRPVTATWC